jgi:drug/metabolite transporter (DMT)-like permease
VGLNTPFSAVREYGLLIVLATLWGGSYPLIKIALESLAPITLMAVRVTVAAVILAAIARYQKHRFPRDLLTWRAFLAQAFFNSIGAWTLLAWGQQFVDSGLAGVLNSTSPIFVIFITLAWTRHEKVGLLRLAGALLGLSGVAIIVGFDNLSELGQDLTAQLAILAGALLYGFAAIYGKRFQDQPPVVTAAGTMIWASVFLCPLAMLVEQPWRLDVSLRSANAATALAIFSTAVALLIYFRLVKTIGSVGVASQSYLRSIIAVTMGVLFMHEPLTPSLLMGTAVIIAAMIMINRRAVPERPDGKCQ